VSRYTHSVLILLLSCTDPIYCIDGSILGPDGCPEIDTGTEPDASSLLTAEQIISDLAALLDYGIPEARTPGEIYSELVSHTNETCPGQVGGAYALLKPCTTAEGYTFSGVSSWNSGLQEQGGNLVYIFGTGLTSMTASPPTGETLIVGGILYFGLITYEAGTLANSWLSATVSYPTDGGWLAADTSSDLHIDFSSDDDGQTLELSGGYTIGSQSVHFDQLIFAEGCATGALRIRDDLGRWYQLTLSDCSGCGPMTIGSTDLGEGCIDLVPALTTLTDVMVAPP
jgi:hypothetical protein